MQTVPKKQAQVAVRPLPSAEEVARLDRCSRAYRAAVAGANRVRGAVQFTSYAVSSRQEGGRTILRATIDEGQSVELRLPVGVGVLLTRGAARGGKGARYEGT